MDLIHTMSEFDRRKNRHTNPQWTKQKWAMAFFEACAIIFAMCLFWFCVFAINGVYHATELTASGNRGSHLSDGLPDAQHARPVSGTAAETVHLLVTRDNKRAM